MKSFQYRIYPTKKQEVKLDRTLSTCRILYNNSLEERIRKNEVNKIERNFDVFPWGKIKYINYYDQCRNNKSEYQQELYSQVYQNVLKRVERSFKNFFNGFGYPRFQGRNRYNSFTYPQYGFEIKENKINLSKIGSIKIIIHRPIEGKIKTCTIKKDIDQWYVIFSCEVKKPTLIKIKNKIGIDVGLTSLITTSDGEQIKSPNFLKKSEDKLIKEQFKLSQKKKQSKNRNKQRIKLAKIHRKIRNQRKDFNHKTSRILVNKYDYIVFENLQIQNMMSDHTFAKSISDVSWNQLITFTIYKAEYAGKKVELIDPKNTTQECSNCGKLVLKDISIRIHNCSCGLILDRDHNAAINILNKSTVGITGKKCL